MKALTDKIIECLIRSKGYIGTRTNNKKAWAQNEGYKLGLQKAIEIVEILEASADFEEVARVVMKHLANPEKYYPHHSVIIDTTHAELLDIKETIEVTDYIIETKGMSNTMSGSIENLPSLSKISNKKLQDWGLKDRKQKHKNKS